MSVTPLMEVSVVNPVNKGLWVAATDVYTALPLGVLQKGFVSYVTIFRPWPSDKYIPAL